MEYQGLEFGRVVRFNRRAGMQIGAVQVLTGPGGEPTGEELIFHYNDGRFIECDDGRLSFAEKTRGARRMYKPRPGEELIYRRVRGTRGTKATPWSFVNQLPQELLIELKSSMAA